MINAGNYCNASLNLRAQEAVVACINLSVCSGAHVMMAQYLLCVHVHAGAAASGYMAARKAQGMAGITKQQNGSYNINVKLQVVRFDSPGRVSTCIASCAGCQQHRMDCRVSRPMPC